MAGLSWTGAKAARRVPASGSHPDLLGKRCVRDGGGWKHAAGVCGLESTAPGVRLQSAEHCLDHEQSWGIHPGIGTRFGGAG